MIPTSKRDENRYIREWIYPDYSTMFGIQFIAEPNYGFTGEIRYRSHWHQFELELYPMPDQNCYELYVYNIHDHDEAIGICPTQIPVNCPPEQAKQFFIDAWMAFKRGLETKLSSEIL